MKNHFLFPMILDLQLFAEGAGGGDGGTGAEGTRTSPSLKANNPLCQRASLWEGSHFLQISDCRSNADTLAMGIGMSTMPLECQGL